MKLEERIPQWIAQGIIKKPGDSLQGVSKARIQQALEFIGRGSSDQVDVVFALLDTTPSWFPTAAKLGFKFHDGASTAHLGCHVGILQRGKGKLDREGRDYWLKPLWELGAVEQVYFTGEAFIDGWPIAKAPTGGYRLSASFLEILKSPEEEWRKKLTAWASADATRSRLKLQAELAATAKASVDSSHEILIKASVEEYAPRFLQGYELVYVDAFDGDRVDAEDRERLKRAGLEIKLEDSMPDALLWNPKTDWLWVIEAVTSDGEVDLHKVEGIQKIAARSGKKGVGLTTAYMTWKDAAQRQGKLKNLAPGTCLWIHEDGSKQFKIETFKAPGELGL